MRPCIFAIVAATSACGQGAQCRSRNGGSYVVDYRQRSGNCDAISEQVVNVSDAPAPDAGCSGPVSVSPDNCAVQTDTTCNGWEVAGQVDWSQDASSAHGTIEVRNTAPGGCEATYDVTWTRQ